MPKPLTPERCKKCGLLTNDPKDMGISKTEWDGLCGYCREGKTEYHMKLSSNLREGIKYLSQFPEKYGER